MFGDGARGAGSARHLGFNLTFGAVKALLNVESDASPTDADLKRMSSSRRLKIHLRKGHPLTKERGVKGMKAYVMMLVLAADFKRWAVRVGNATCSGHYTW